MSDNDLKSMTLGDHLDELRYRLIMIIAGIVIGLLGCLFFGRFFLALLAWPYESAMIAAGRPPQLQAIELAEQFMVYLKTSLVFGIIFSCPWGFYHLWKFVSAGLYKNERKFIYISTPACAILFAAGAAFFILVIAPITMKFFVTFDTGVKYVEVMPTMKSYMSFVLTLTLIFGAAFQLPIATVFAQRIGIISIEMLVKVRKFVIMALLILSAIVTPPDVISQISLAVPLYILFEASIVICKILNRRKTNIMSQQKM